MPFLGKQPTSGFASIVKDDFAANGTDTVFTLSKPVASANDIAVFVGNVRQEPTDSYTVNGTSLTMTEAPDSGINFYALHIAGTMESSIVPADGTISSSKIVDNAITESKLASTLDLSSKNITMPVFETQGIKFPATQVPSADANTLDDYEEGTWIPSIEGQTTAGTATYGTRDGKYTKIGNLVYATFRVAHTAHTGTGGCIITGLPFAASAPSYMSGTLATFRVNLGGTGENVTLYTIGAIAEIFLSRNSDTWVGATMTNANCYYYGFLIYNV